MRATELYFSKEKIFMSTNPGDVPAEQPAPPSQPAEPTVPPTEAPNPGGDVDIPSPGTESPGQ